ncbi:MAG: divalent metal cation transporter [Chloroflexi bacterium]|nr:divalent metal cation transporter [Chloroflexota bacterium]
MIARIFTSLIAVGALVTLIPGLPLIQLLLVVQVVNGLLLPPLLVFIVKLASDSHVMGEYRNGRMFNLLAWGTVIVVALLAVLLILATVVAPLFGFTFGS